MCALFFVWPSLSNATYTDGIAAYKSGDYSKAYLEWLPLAEAGNPRAEYGLGLLYRYGRGISADIPRARHWLKRSASRGFGAAFYLLGLSYQLPPDADEAKSIELIRKAARLGVAKAQHDMGMRHLSGTGVKKDTRLAERYFTLAANLGHKPSIEQKRLMLENADSTPSSETETIARRAGRANEDGGTKCYGMLISVIEKKKSLVTKSKLLDRCLEAKDPTKICRGYFNAMELAFTEHQTDVRNYRGECTE